MLTITTEPFSHLAEEAGQLAAAHWDEVEAALKGRLRAVSSAGEPLTPAFRAEIVAADSKSRLEDLYLPYKPKRRTKGMIAREAGRRVRLSTQLVYVAGEMPRGMTRSRTREEI